MKRFLRSQLERRAPTVFNGIRALRHRRYFRGQFSRFHAEARAQLFPDGAPISVLTGPFRGLRYFEEAVWGSITPKWLGSYEAELHPVLAEIGQRSYATVIDVGSAEGYYAVGLAVFLPSVKVIAFDTDFISRGQVRRLAKLNQVEDRVQIGIFCHHSDLDAFSQGATLVVCDIEGFEAQLLDPAQAASLLRDDILVEVHESSDSSHTVEELLQARFAASHRIERIVAEDRGTWIAQNRPQIPPGISDELLRKTTEENRAIGRVWLWMQASRS